MSRKNPKPNGCVEGNPEATPKLNAKHIRILEHMKNHRLGRIAAYPDRSISSYMLAELISLEVAIAELKEVLSAR